MDEKYKFLIYEILILFDSLIIYLIYFLSIDSLDQHNDYKYTEYLKDIRKNWGKQYISEIISTSNNSCPQNYSFLINNYGPNLSINCVCNDNDPDNFLYGKIRSGVCTSLTYRNDNLEYCKNQFNSSEIFNISYRGKTLCSKSSYGELLVTNSSSCYQNYRSCGIVDSIGRLICIRIDLSCPINSIQIIGKNDTNPLNNISYKRVDLDDKVLLYSNEYY